jgi:hypothetical protein
LKHAYSFAFQQGLSAKPAATFTGISWSAPTDSSHILDRLLVEQWHLKLESGATDFWSLEVASLGEIL